MENVLTGKGEFPPGGLQRESEGEVYSSGVYLSWTSTVNIWSSSW